MFGFLSNVPISNPTVADNTKPPEQLSMLDPTRTASCDAFPELANTLPCPANNIADHIRMTAHEVALRLRTNPAKPNTVGSVDSVSVASLTMRLSPTQI